MNVALSIVETYMITLFYSLKCNFFHAFFVIIPCF